MTSLLLLSTSVYCYGCGLLTCIKRLSDLISSDRRAKSAVRATTQVNLGKREFRPLATPKPLNLSSPKVAHVITFRMYIYPHAKFSHAPSRGFFSWTGRANYVKRRGSARFSGIENKNLTFNPFIPEKPPFLTRFWRDRLRQISA